MEEASFRFHPAEEGRAGIRREDMEGGGLDPLVDGPTYRPIEHGSVVLVHAEDEAPVHHHPQAVQPPHRLAVIAVEVLDLALGAQARRVQGLEADEEAAQAGGHRLFEEGRLQDGRHRPRGLPDAAEPAHPLEERCREAHVAEQVVVQEVKVAAEQARDLREGRVHPLRVEALPSREEGLLVAEVAGVGTTPGHHDRVGHEVEVTLDEVAPDGGQGLERPDLRAVEGLWLSGA